MLAAVGIRATNAPTRSAVMGLRAGERVDPEWFNRDDAAEQLRSLFE